MLEISACRREKICMMLEKKRSEEPTGTSGAVDFPCGLW